MNARVHPIEYKILLSSKCLVILKSYVRRYVCSTGRNRSGQLLPYPPIMLLRRRPPPTSVPPSLRSARTSLQCCHISASQVLKESRGKFFRSQLSRSYMRCWVLQWCTEYSDLAFPCLSSSSLVNIRNAAVGQQPLLLFHTIVAAVHVHRTLCFSVPVTLPCSVPLRHGPAQANLCSSLGHAGRRPLRHFTVLIHLPFCHLPLVCGLR